MNRRQTIATAITGIFALLLPRRAARASEQVKPNSITYVPDSLVVRVGKIEIDGTMPYSGTIKIDGQSVPFVQGVTLTSIAGRDPWRLKLDFSPLAAIPPKQAASNKTDA